MYRGVRLVSLALVAAALVQAAGAEPPAGKMIISASAPLDGGMFVIKQAAVVTGDLDLSSSAGAEALYARIDAAAKALCGIRANAPVRLAGAAEKCRRETVAGAVAKAKIPLLTDVASGR